MSAHSTAAQIKSSLDHPIIDADGHWIEYGPVFTEQLRKIGGDKAVAGWTAVGGGVRGVLSMSVEERRRRRISQELFWGHPSKNTRDFATAVFPRRPNSAAYRDSGRACGRCDSCRCRGTLPSGRSIASRRRPTVPGSRASRSPSGLPPASSCGPRADQRLVKRRSALRVSPATDIRSTAPAHCSSRTGLPTARGDRRVQRPIRRGVV